MATVPLPQRDQIEQVDEARIYGYDDDGSAYVAVDVNADGELVVDDQWVVSPIDNGTTTAGSANAADLDLGSHRKDVDVFYDLSGAATVTIEVSTDDTNWRQFEQFTTSGAESDVLQFSTAFRYVRVYADANLTRIEMSSKGA